MTEVCGCGFEAKNGAGLSAHKRFCDEGDSESSQDSYETPTTVSTAVAEDVYIRDSEKCVRCESTDDLTIHMYDECGEDIPQNLVTLCSECDEFISGGHPITKRTQVLK